MDRFTCNSSLQLRLSFVERTLMLKMHHSYYTPYRNILLSSQAIDFINSRVLTQTPSEIYQNLLTMKIQGVDRIAQHQIYYQWQQANKRNWRHDDNEFVSSTLLLGGISDKYRHETFILSNLRDLGIYINASISSLALTTREIAIDTTFGTNNAGMSLFAVLAELDGIEIPLAYLFLERINSDEPTVSGNLIQILVKFLEKLRLSGLAPSFVGCDKDKSEINAIQEVWPLSNVQLCFWHAKRAIRARLQDSTKSNTQKHYFPDEAKTLVPCLEICWGSHPINRSDREHRFVS